MDFLYLMIACLFLLARPAKMQTIHPQLHNRDIFMCIDVSNSVDELNLDIQGAASRDDSNLSQFLSFIGIVCLVIFVPFGIYLIYNNEADQ